MDFITFKFSEGRESIWLILQMKKLSKLVIRSGQELRSWHSFQMGALANNFLTIQYSMLYRNRIVFVFFKCTLSWVHQAGLGDKDEPVQTREKNVSHRTGRASLIPSPSPPTSVPLFWKDTPQI